MPGGGGAEGRLAAEPSRALDSFCRALLALPDVSQPLPQPEAVMAGLQVVLATARERGSPGGGFWTFKFEPIGGSGGYLILRRDADAIEAGFQVDGEGRPRGAFYLSSGGQEQGYSLEQSATGWALRKWQGERTVEFPLPASAAALWDADQPANLRGGPGDGGGEGVASDVGAAGLAAPETQWNYVRGGAAEGPIAESALRALLETLPPDTLVWNPGLPEWVSARELGLAGPPAAAPAPAPAGWELAAFAGPAAGHRYAIAGRTRVGSGENCEACLHDPSAAPVHALLMEKPDGFWIADNRTDGGTFVNDARLQGPALLAEGDVIGVGDTDLVFRRVV
jgi:hypothetical protein